jgi:hypothetical protein
MAKLTLIAFMAGQRSIIKNTSTDITGIDALKACSKVM